jgi:hypothetical protein
MSEDNEKITLKTKIRWFILDILEFLGKIEMKIKYLFHFKYFNSLSKDDIPKDTFYCYDGCRMYGERCPYLDYSTIYKELYCHYAKKFDFPLLTDECKICGVSEFEENEDITNDR